MLRLFVALVLLLPGLAHAGITVDLQFTTPAQGAARSQVPVFITFSSSREEKKGGAEPDLVGQARNSMGVPFGVKATGSVEAKVKELVAASLSAAGYRLATQQQGAARLHVQLENFWCDGLMHYEMRVKVRFFLVAPGQQATGWEQVVEGAGGATPTMQFQKGMSEGFKRAMDDFIAKAMPLFQGADFTAVLAGQAPAGGAVASAGGAGGQVVVIQEVLSSDYKKAVNRSVVVDKANGTEVRGVVLAVDQQAVVVVRRDGLVVAVPLVQIKQLRLGT